MLQSFSLESSLMGEANICELPMFRLTGFLRRPLFWP